MKYYSKSPKDFYKEREEVNHQRQSKLWGGRRILIIDIFLLVALAALFVYITTDYLKDDSNSKSVITWKDWQLNAHCKSGSCELKVSLMEPAADTPEKAIWILKDENNSVLFEQPVELLKTSEGIFRSDFILPAEWSKDRPGGKIPGEISVVVTNSNNDEKITVRAYP